MTFFKKFIACERGATAIEYGLIAALISIALITAMSALAPKIAGTFAITSGKMPQ